MKNPITLYRSEEIIAIVPEKCEGPGWNNDVAWVYIKNNTDRSFRTVCLQSTEFTKNLQVLFEIGREVQLALKYSIDVVIDGDSND